MNISGTKASNLDLGILTDLNAVAKRLANQDSTIWGPNTEAKTRLNWVTLPIKSRELLPILDAISAWSRSCGHEYFILCGMGGSSLAPEVIASTYGKSLVVLDSTDPAQILNSVPDDLSKTLVIISSKSGTTIETQSQFEFYKKKFVDNNLDPVDHIIMI
ncbi:MAG: glucose-6-phosphate isomerase, partial [Actinobacteria bacterium]|nr:glucose-6-phosphate isomerase [Actinomycetota bacterium]